MTEETICKICGNSYKNLGSHIRSAHHMSVEEYEMFQVNDTSDSGEMFENISNQSDGMFEEKEKIHIEESDTSLYVEAEQNNSELSDILEKYKITKKELIMILENRRRRQNVPESQTPEAVAKRLSTEKEPSTVNVKVAEILVKEYGFSIKGGGPTTRGGTIKKTWFMTKNKRDS